MRGREASLSWAGVLLAAQRYPGPVNTNTLRTVPRETSQRALKTHRSCAPGRSCPTQNVRVFHVEHCPSSQAPGRRRVRQLPIRSSDEIGDWLIAGAIGDRAVATPQQRSAVGSSRRSDCRAPWIQSFRTGKPPRTHEECDRWHVPGSVAQLLGVSSGGGEARRAWGCRLNAASSTTGSWGGRPLRQITRQAEWETQTGAMVPLLAARAWCRLPGRQHASPVSLPGQTRRACAERAFGRRTPVGRC